MEVLITALRLFLLNLKCLWRLLLHVYRNFVGKMLNEEIIVAQIFDNHLLFGLSSGLFTL